MSTKIFVDCKPNGCYVLQTDVGQTHAVKSPQFAKLSAKLELRLMEQEKARIEVIARYSRARSTSDFLRPLINAAMDREQKRLGLSDDEIADAWQRAREERQAKAKERSPNKGHDARFPKRDSLSGTK